MCIDHVQKIPAAHRFPVSSNGDQPEPTSFASNDIASHHWVTISNALGLLDITEMDDNVSDQFHPC